MKKVHRQNEYGLSYPAMIVLTIMNSETIIEGRFCDRAASIKDIYVYLRTHVKPIQEMDQKVWERTERVIRHSLSQTTYFHRYQLNEGGRPQIHASKVKDRCLDGPDKGALWTIHPAHNEDADKAQARINKVFGIEKVAKFRQVLVNPAICNALIKGKHGWRGPYGKPLGLSDSMMKLEKQKHDKGAGYCAPLIFPSLPSASPASERPKRKRLAREDPVEHSDTNQPGPSTYAYPALSYSSQALYTYGPGCSQQDSEAAYNPQGYQFAQPQHSFYPYAAPQGYPSPYFAPTSSHPFYPSPAAYPVLQTSQVPCSPQEANEESEAYPSDNSCASRYETSDSPNQAESEPRTSSAEHIKSEKDQNIDSLTQHDQGHMYQNSAHFSVSQSSHQQEYSSPTDSPCPSNERGSHRFYDSHIESNYQHWSISPNLGHEGESSGSSQADGSHQQERRIRYLST
ncbi:hypothetical protein QR680_007332 [Steinernema hermaphroditum]|uniref:Fork-head domain-containing protein n=1 Tax=Steinernema hermaphroditum TaxID=289476 RepID=A0AA39ICX2_9BILA|nr:hypothetical protein QR680_007332 [Steinernema hermaphroditum]